MFRALLIVCILLISVQTNAQLSGQAKIDSLLYELPKAKGDTNEVKLLDGLCFTYYSINPDKGIKYGLKGLKLAKNINWEKGVARIYNNLGVNYSFGKSNYSKALQYYQKALKINENLGDKKNISKNLGNIGIVYQNQPNYPKAIDYYERTLKILKELGDKKGEAAYLGNIGTVYFRLSDYPKALENFGKALGICEELEDTGEIARYLGNIGLVYQNQSKYPKALEFYGKALGICEELEDTGEIARYLGNIGVIYDYQSDYPKALEYYEKALKINKELGDKNGIAKNFGNIGGVYAVKFDYANALEYFEKSLMIFREIGKKNSVANILGNIGNVYALKSDFPKALEYYRKALDLHEELENKSGIALFLANLGSLYLKISQDSVSIKSDDLNKYVSIEKEINLNHSLEYSTKALQIFEEIGGLYGKSTVLKNLADAYKQKGNMFKAYEALEEHHKLKDSVFNQENADKIAALEKAREDDLKQKEIEKQKLKIAEQEKREQLILYFSIGFFIVMAIVMFIIFRLLKRSDKLLYNVLPVSIAKRLKKKEHPISDYFTQASIVFIDIVNFTEMASDSDPQNLVSNLNTIFTKYDTIANKYGLEKIKTIGDSYMAAAGIPEVQKDNTHRAAQMALEVKELMEDYHTADGTKIEVRIGLDCGPVVAGVIGENKFIYDMWSDAVNTASHMESSSESGQVHITERFKEAVSEYEEFCYLERGEIEIKGKGMMKTYYIENKEVESV